MNWGRQKGIDSRGIRARVEPANNWPTRRGFDSSSGDLTQVPGSPFAAGQNPGERARKGAQIVAANYEGQGNVMFWTYPGGTFIYEMTTGVYYPYGVTDSLPSP
jgi:hypothetical protein